MKLDNLTCGICKIKKTNLNRIYVFIYVPQSKFIKNHLYIFLKLNIVLPLPGLIICLQVLVLYSSLNLTAIFSYYYSAIICHLFAYMHIYRSTIEFSLILVLKIWQMTSRELGCGFSRC